mmetsp:Transcript_13516/g.31801  ORF Transcript_13516/g.31801 Transcript_13516/m.31801 type:complete len:673 (-) Transcript_13516:44-2062(-)
MVRPGKPGGGPAKKQSGKGGKGKSRGGGAKQGRGKSVGAKVTKKVKGKGKGKGAAGGKASGKGKGKEKGGAKGKGKSSVQQEAAAELEESRRIAALSTDEPSKTTSRGVKRGKPGDPASAKKAGPKVGKDGAPKVKRLGFRKARKKEVTALYAELTNPGRSRKGEEVVKDILALLQARSKSLEEYSNSKIGSRILQACLKWGTREQRRQVLTTLKEHLPKLAVNNHGHIVVQKLLKYAARTAAQRKPTEAERKEQAHVVRVFLDAFRGRNLQIVFYHKYGSRVINGLYFSEVIPAKDKRRLLHEVLVPETVTLARSQAPGSQTMREVLKDLTEEQRNSMKAHLSECAEKAVNKELLGVDIVHFIFQHLCEDADEASLRKVAELCAAGSPFLLSSKPGAEALLRLLGVFSAKERKAFCKDLKGKFAQLTMNSVDYVVMIRLLMTVDDTVMLSKTLLAEWIADIETLIFDKYAHKALVWLLMPDDPRIFSPYERACAALPAPSSVKAKNTRLEELVRVVRAPLRNALLADPLKAAADLHAKDVLIGLLTMEWDGSLIEALVESSIREVDKDDCGLLGTGTSITTLLVLLRMEPAQAGVSLQKLLWERCLCDRVAAVATTRCAFLLLELLKSGSCQSLVRKSLLQERSQVAAAVEAAKAKGSNVSGAEKLLGSLA